MLGEKKISIFRLYGHLNRPIDYFYMLLALIGSVGSGIAMPLQAYITSDLFSDVSNISDYITPEEIDLMMKVVEDTFNKQIKLFLIFGIIALDAIFLVLHFGI